MPTVIIPTIAGTYVRDLFRFSGDGVHYRRSENTCVAPGFACGIAPKLPASFTACTEADTVGKAGVSFVNSAKCLPSSKGPQFYLALRAVKCPANFCPKDLEWGVMEIVEAGPLSAASDLAYNRFKSERGAALRAINPDKNGNAVYTTAAGLQIAFTLKDSPRALIVLSVTDDFKVPLNVSGDQGPAISSIGGSAPPPWVTTGGVIDADGKGRAVIKGPGGPVTIDFSDWSNPQRKP
jgi:hypothetical protein